MKLTFYGAAQQVTGSNFLLESGDQKILIDCGLHQGSSFTEKQNFNPFRYNPKDISAVLITHPHIDHIGLLPKLYKDGFRGKIYSTAPAKDFARLLLLDSEHILMQEAERFKKPNLYGVREVEEVMASWIAVDYQMPVNLGNFVAYFYTAGHILGSSFIVVEAEGKKVAFSGDLGNSPAPIIGDKDALPDDIDYCLMESTYGNRIHEPMKDRKDILEKIIEEAIQSKGVLMIPAFAMERTQQLLFELNDLVENNRIPRVPIFMDSPLAIKLTDVYKTYPQYFDEEARKLVESGDAIFNFPGLKRTLTTEESKGINNVPAPKVIIAGAGMSNAGRILHHEKRYLSDEKSTLLIVGYQARGSLGRLILDGKKSGRPFDVKMFGEKIPVRAKIRAIGAYSAHSDQPQLIEWLRPAKSKLKKVFLVHGEMDQMEPLAKKIKEELSLTAEIPKERASYEL